MMIFNHTPILPFQQWIWHTPKNKLYLTMATTALIIQFVLFKWYYPYPNFFPDSYSYLEAAYLNQDINMWPVGYSKFIRFFSVFTNSDIALILFQYLLLQFSVAYFILSILYLFNPAKWISWILVFFGIFNPILLHISNFISSDALFTGFSIIWATQLFWLLCQPSRKLLIWHGLILLFSFTIRYNSLYYPTISILLILLSGLSIRRKITGITFIVVLISGFSIHTARQYEKSIGTRQFSAFGGWQLASNALYMYAHQAQDPQEAIPKQFRGLHEVVVRHMDSLRHMKKRPDSLLGVYYLWDEHAPLAKYMRDKWRKNTTTEYFKKWATMAPLYGAYGAYLIKKHPAAFGRYYVWPNLVNYYIPTVEFLGDYNMGRDTVDQLAKIWFGYKTNHVSSKSKDRKIKIAEWYPTLIVTVNLCFVCGFIGFLLLDGFKKVGRSFGKALRLMMLLWLANLFFSVLASPIVLRYQVFPMVISFPFALLLIRFLMEADKLEEAKNSQQINEVPLMLSDISPEA